MAKQGLNISTTDVILVGGGLLVFTAIKRLLIAGGLAAGEGTKKASELIVDPNSYFKPSYYKRAAGARIITRAKAEQLAKQIHGAFGVFQDDFNAIMAAFSQLPSKAAVSWLSDIFQQRYKEDLLTFLTNGGGLLPWDGLSDEQLKKLITFTNKLPNK